MDLSHLNTPQRQAVRHLDSPLLVLAGAGSGKTRVITHKIAYLIQETGLDARHIAAVTFTNKAAREMKSRVAQLLDKRAARGLMVSTFHTLGLNIIRREINVLGYRSGFSIMDGQDSYQLLQSLSEQHLIADKERLQAFQKNIGDWKNGFVSPEKALKLAEDEETAYAAKLYDLYQRQLKAYNAVDFDDLITVPARLFVDNEEALNRWQNRIRYLLVDEYQDTNTSQYQLVKSLTGIRGALTVVGDDDQSIYAWRGAQMENLNLLKTDFPRLKVVKLEQNYRSTGNILAAANHLIANNPHIFEKRLWSDKGLGDNLKVLSSRDEQHEAEQVISTLISHQFQHRTDYSAYAILYRSNYQSRLFEQVLRNHKIPYFISGGTSFFARSEIKDIMGYLRVITNPDDDTAFLRVINTPRREIGPGTLEKLGSYAQEREISLFAACFEMGLTTCLPEHAVKKLHTFAEWVGRVQDEAERGAEASRIVRQVIADIDYELWLQDISSDQRTADKRMNNVEELIAWLIRLQENDEEDKTLKDLVAHLTLMDILERQEEDKPEERVALMTLHAAKGLEFPYVFLVGMEEDLLPHMNNQDEPCLLQEERRLAYVGITRAEKNLSFSISQKRKRYGEIAVCEPSRFLYELPKELLTWSGQEAPDPEERLANGKAHLANIMKIIT